MVSSQAASGLRGRVRHYWDMWKRILQLSRRPDEEEFNLLLKLNLLGFTIVGGIAYIIHLVHVLVVR
ncbi:MAG: protein translocase SEC61 complex subunit gamma [Desulfurococcales archaeon]|nr:protein translocase SEC61 complex subunit gamma [Desulfurococcales archaeon]